MKNIPEAPGKRSTNISTKGLAPSPRATPWRPYVFVLVATLQLFSWEPLFAQQRDPAVEIYGLTGTYYFGNRRDLLKGGEWKPQFGAGVLFPLGAKWALMIDGVTSHLEVNEGPHNQYTYHPFTEFYRQNPGIQNNDVTTQRLISVLPSVVRLWRRDRFSIYIGLGLGFEKQCQLIRYQPAYEQEDPDGNRVLVRAEEFVESKNVSSIPPFNLRAGVLMSLAPRVVLRAGHSVMFAYADARASQSLEVGVGYRF